MQLQLNLMVDSIIDVNLMSTWHPRAPFPRPPHWRKIRKRKRLQQWRKNGTTWVQRDAIAFNRATVASRTVKVPRCVDSAGALSRYTDVGSIITIKSPLHLGAWERGLKLHPDESFVEYILDGIKHGVSINYEGPWESVTSKNWPSTKNNISPVKQSVQNDISKGRKAGQFKKPLLQPLLGRRWVHSGRSAHTNTE